MLKIWSRYSSPTKLHRNTDGASRFCILGRTFRPGLGDSVTQANCDLDKLSGRLTTCPQANSARLANLTKWSTA
jgi:hypothetical protein